jgi:hypothetical protein
MIDKTTAKFLQRLLKEKEIAYSQVPKTVKPDLEPYISSGVIDKKRAGCGNKLILRQSDVIAGAVQSRFPQPEIADDIPQRAKAILKARDSKVGDKRHSQFILPLRAHNQIRWKNKEHVLPLDEHTHRYGCASLLLHPDDQWHTDKPLALLENQECFFNSEQLYNAGSEWSFAYYSGMISEKFLNWLANKPRTEKIIHYPDFDPIGLMNYKKLKKRLHRIYSVDLAVPSNFEELLTTFGNDQIYLKNLSKMEALVNAEDITICQIARILQKHGLGLEQEVISYVRL